jgi:hypothetical protein
MAKKGKGRKRTTKPSAKPGKRRATGAASGVGTAKGVGASTAEATGRTRKGTGAFQPGAFQTGVFQASEVKLSASTTPSETGLTVGRPEIGSPPLTINPALQPTQGAVEAPPAAVAAPQSGEANLQATSSLASNAIIIPAPIPVTPTVYPDSPQGTVIINNYITINRNGVEFLNFSTKLDALINQLNVAQMRLPVK